jgi:hypothetical protein
LQGILKSILANAIIGMHVSNTHDMFYLLPPVCNEQLKKMWGRILNIFPFVYYLSLANRCLPGSHRHIVRTLAKDMDFNDILSCSNTQVRFVPEEKA